MPARRPRADADQSSASPVQIDKSDALSNWLAAEENQGRVVRTRLKTSDRVIARVTDGIYRQPASALRELISNAWDADANNVTILTDAPRFSRIYVRDDGVGMSYESLAHLLHSIGGSAKRREEGQRLGISASDDPDRSPGGRPLIGKIGIGLFSVSQLSHRFRIITKVRDADYRLVAEVRLRTYAEDGEDLHGTDNDTFLTGEVLISRQAATDIEAHGTDIVIDEVKPRVRDLLRSADRWQALATKQAAVTQGDTDTATNIRVEEPQYHSGWIEELQLSDDGANVLTQPPKLPWQADDPPSIRMNKLVMAVQSESTRTERPDLASTLDTYLETIWTLGLSAPVRYVDRHPFDLTGEYPIRLFWISNEARGQASELSLTEDQTVRQAVAEQVEGSPELLDGEQFAVGEFTVIVDGVELRRPIRFDFIQSDRRALNKAILFVGKYAPDLRRVNPSQRGGDLSLEGYLFWNGRVIPKENNGVLIRIRGSSGAVFDPTFFKYQVSEQTRLRQITAELLIRRGLDAALNIDRESFNFSHPHVQLVTLWLHRAIRQLTNKHKDLTSRTRSERRNEAEANSRDVVSRYAANVWTRRQGEEPPPEVVVADDARSARLARKDGFIALTRSNIPALVARSGASRTEREAKAQALVRILAAYGLLSDRSYDEQQAMVADILSVFLPPDVQ
jgi:hypothetical protein